MLSIHIFVFTLDKKLIGYYLVDYSFSKVFFREVKLSATLAVQMFLSSEVCF